MRVNWPLALVLIAYLGLASFYNFANPIFEAPDELWHYRFVVHLADGAGLPVIYEDPEKNVAGQEGGQPPLYYLLAALATLWIDKGDLGSFSIASPLLQGVGDGANLFVHTAAEDFPYRGTPLAVHLIRGISTLAGLATVFFTYLIGLEALGGHRRLALTAAALTALNPQFLFISTSVSNDTLITAVSALVLLLMLRGLDRGFSLGGVLALGAALAAASLSKVSGLALLPLALAGLVLRAWLERSPVPLRACLLLAPMVAAGAGWWYLRNWGLYGDPLGLSVFVAAAGGAKPVITPGYLLSEAAGIWTSYWALFGWSNVPASPPFYVFYGAICVLGMVGLLRLPLARRLGTPGLSRPPLLAESPASGTGVPPVRTGQEPAPLPDEVVEEGPGKGAHAPVVARHALPLQALRQHRWGAGRSPSLSAACFQTPAATILLLWAGVYIVLVFQYATMLHGMQGRLLFPALPAISVLLAAGINSASPGRWAGKAPAALAAALFLPALLAPVLFIMPAYPRAGLMDAAQLEAIPHRSEVTYGNMIQLVGYRVDNPRLAPGQPMEVTLYWRALSSPRVNYTVFVHAFDPWGNKLGEWDAPLGRKAYPTAAWRPGDALQETYTIPLAEPQDRPSYIRVEVGLYLYPSLERLAATDMQERPLGSSVTVLRAVAAGPPVRAPSAGLEVPLGSQLLLVGYQGADGALRPGQTLEGRLWWKAMEKPDQDYTVFVQLVGPEGLVAQYDSQPRGGAYPTSLWGIGEIVEDFFRLAVPQGAPPGAYRLIAGMYDAATGKRLSSGGEDHILLAKMALERP